MRKTKRSQQKIITPTSKILRFKRMSRPISMRAAGAQNGSIADGGAAMTAYSRMQFTQMTEAECERVAKALLKYCELDTLAMVMIYQFWVHEALPARKKRGAAMR